MSIRKYHLITTRRDANGKLIYKTEQAHKDRVDVNNIIKKYARTGIIDHMHFVDPQFTECTGMDFKSAMDKVIAIEQKFQELPAKIRKHFDHDATKFLTFMENPDNKDEAKKLGIMRSDWVDNPAPEPTPEPTT